jgi:hypothetical protein
LFFFTFQGHVSNLIPRPLPFIIESSADTPPATDTDTASAADYTACTTVADVVSVGPAIAEAAPAAPVPSAVAGDLPLRSLYTHTSAATAAAASTVFAAPTAASAAAAAAAAPAAAVLADAAAVFAFAAAAAAAATSAAVTAAAVNPSATGNIVSPTANAATPVSAAAVVANSVPTASTPPTDLLLLLWPSVPAAGPGGD